jgi:molybdopterin molybdotransferase
MTDRPDPPPVLLSEALVAIGSQLSGRRDQEAVPLSHATGRILGADLVSNVDLPHRNSSAVDGFAVRAADLAPGGFARLSLIGEAAAGHPFHGIIGQGQAVRVFTGASIPQGADLVVMQESCSADGGGVEVRWDGRGRTHIRPRGEGISSGAKVIGAGRRLGTCDVALAGALGCTELSVYKRLRVGGFSTGDELREPGEPLGDGQVWDANRCLLRGLLVRMGCEVADFGILRDEPRALEGALSAAARDCDLLVTSGGMSVGREDHMRSIIGRAARWTCGRSPSSREGRWVLAISMPARSWRCRAIPSPR